MLIQQMTNLKSPEYVNNESSLGIEQIFKLYEHIDRVKIDPELANVYVYYLLS